MADRAWLKPLERMLNRRIEESETARAELIALGTKSFGVRVAGLPGLLILRAQAGELGVALESLPAGLDAWVAGSAVALARVAAGGGESLIREGMVEVHGDGEVAEGFWKLLGAIGPDWEEELSRLTGDVAAHQLARGARAVASLAGRTLDTLGRDLAEYLQEESRDLVGRLEQERYFRDVERLRDDVERQQARISRLEQRRPPERDS